MGILGKETRPPPNPAGDGPPTSTRHYLLGLSLGVSSTVLLDLLNANITHQLAKNHAPPFTLTVLHLTTHPSPSKEKQDIFTLHRARYPLFTFLAQPLPPTPISHEAMSVASRTDIRRTQTRRALLAAARDRGCQALLLGHSTTALAELTLAEAAKGRGWAVPWFVGDGPVSSPQRVLPAGERDGDEGKGEGAERAAGNGGEKAGVAVLVYHPLRDALRKELATYAGLAEPPLTELVVETADDDGAAGRAVVSHKDLSIEAVMRRYFAEVEASYPSVVANVARTTGKLVRAGGDAGCALCGMPLDEDGDERWRGELGIVKGLEASRAGLKGRLCYGCERSVGG